MSGSARAIERYLKARDDVIAEAKKLDSKASNLPEDMRDFLGLAISPPDSHLAAPRDGHH